MNHKKNTAYAVLAVALVLGIGAVLLPGEKKISEIEDNGGKLACTVDAFKCSDGTWVGRSGPHCQFVCPVTATSSTNNSLRGALNELIVGYGISLTPLTVVEDSRCPVNVRCIQAGTVRLRARLVNNGEATTTIFTLGKSIGIAHARITLVTVEPARMATTTIKNEDYRFSWGVVSN